MAVTGLSVLLRGIISSGKEGLFCLNYWIHLELNVKDPYERVCKDHSFCQILSPIPKQCIEKSSVTKKDKITFCDLY